MVLAAVVLGVEVTEVHVWEITIFTDVLEMILPALVLLHEGWRIHVDSYDEWDYANTQTYPEEIRFDQDLLRALGIHHQFKKGL